jgi:hypothetical protein
MRADNQGEGGILALTALLPPRNGAREGTRGVALGRPILIGLGIFGAALLYGEGMITPAISILGAVEGLSVATPLFTIRADIRGHSDWPPDSAARHAPGRTIVRSGYGGVVRDHCAIGVVWILRVPQY